MFTGREKELHELEEAYSHYGFCFFVVQGSRGAGKTTLLEEFCRNKAAIFFTVSAEKSSRSNLNRFSEQILNFFYDNSHSTFQFWDDALKYIVKLTGDIRIVVVIDGFDMLAERDPAFMNMFTRSVEKEMINSNIFLAVTCNRNNFIRKDRALSDFIRNMKLGKFLNEENARKLAKEALKHEKGISSPKFIRKEADSIILKEGEKDRSIYKIISGHAVCYLNYGTENEYILGSLKENRTFGEYSMLTGNPAIYTVTAYTDMLLLKIEREDFEKFIEMNSQNSIEIMNNMANMMNLMTFNINQLNKELNLQP